MGRLLRTSGCGLRCSPYACTAALLDHTLRRSLRLPSLLSLDYSGSLRFAGLFSLRIGVARFALPGFSRFASGWLASLCRAFLASHRGGLLRFAGLFLLRIEVACFALLDFSRFASGWFVSFYLGFLFLASSDDRQVL